MNLLQYWGLTLKAIGMFLFGVSLILVAGLLADLANAIRKMVGEGPGATP